MTKKILLILCVLMTLLFSGCATKTKMAFSDEKAAVQISDKPIYLMTATLKNAYQARYQPRLIVVNVEKQIVKGDADRINFTMDDKAKVETGSLPDGNSYLLRMELAQDQYVIRGLTSMGSAVPFNGFFFAPMHSKLEAGKAGIYYLGHIEATVRERKNNEFKAGPSIPLIDQAATGASGGTFDIEITDQWQKDEAAFLAKFPALKGVAVQKAILPTFDRALAQQFWEKN
jgi:hypothetical protein